jgi:hypothetical protein
MSFLFLRIRGSGKILDDFSVFLQIPHKFFGRADFFKSIDPLLIKAAKRALPRPIPENFTRGGSMPHIPNRF